MFLQVIVLCLFPTRRNILTEYYNDNLKFVVLDVLGIRYLGGSYAQPRKPHVSLPGTLFSRVHSLASSCSILRRSYAHRNKPHERLGPLLLGPARLSSLEDRYFPSTGYDTLPSLLKREACPRATRCVLKKKKVGSSWVHCIHIQKHALCLRTNRLVFP